jgi:gamma-glutamyltranspeptidase / glutathione hydrolase
MRIVASVVYGLIALQSFTSTAMGQSDSAVARQRDIVVPSRSMVTTKLGIVAASQPLAARAGVQILEAGGNAIDAAIAANAALGLMEPAMNGVGGDLFAIVYEAKTKTVYGLNSSGWAPSGLTPELLASKGMRTMPRRGIYAVTVPGAVAGWDALRTRFGKLDLATILAPTIWYAENGFPVTQVVSEEWGRGLATLKAQPNATATYLIDGRTPREGEVFRNLDLARTLRDIAARGRDGFYKGRVADAILGLSRELGGTMTTADLTEFKAEWVEPLKTTYRGWTVYELPPNSQGIAALTMLRMMERFPFTEMGFHSTKAMHVMIEAKKLAYADMLRYVADPRFSRAPVAQMLDTAHATAHAKLIDMTRANCDPAPSIFQSVTDAHGGDTIYLTVIDQEGNIVSLIQSIYSTFGSGLVPTGTGFALHNRGNLFTLEAGRPNTLAPRKRPLHTIIPAFMQKGDVQIGFGIMGGWNQAQAHAQFVSNIADYGMTIQQALDAGRFTKGSFSGCDLDIEASIAGGVRDSLTALGHKLDVAGPRSATFGWGQAVMNDRNGVHWGASEPRHDGAAVPQGAPVTGGRARP